MKNSSQSDQMGGAGHVLTEKRARVDDTTAQSQADWRLEPHVCRECFGRLVSRPLLADLREYRCTNCEASCQHTDPAALCSCGIKIRKRNAPGRSGGPMVDAGVRCILNPERGPAFPSMYVAAEVPRAKRDQTVNLEVRLVTA